MWIIWLTTETVKFIQSELEEVAAGLPRACLGSRDYIGFEWLMSMLTIDPWFRRHRMPLAVGRKPANLFGLNRSQTIRKSVFMIHSDLQLYVKKNTRC
jgi:hypothetical protein